MSSFVQPYVNFLNADATLMATLTGGAWNFTDAGRKGINRLQLPGAYDDNSGFLKPVAVLAEMDEELDEQVVGPAGNRFSTLTPLYIRIYDHGDKGYDAIATAEARIYTLLNCKPQIIANAWQAIHRKTLKDRREANLKDACYWQVLYHVHGWRT